ncbi:MAG: PilZ domain-containing protein [Candidatus Omnitrophica bacterium]|nr:PilZ domain-containing protein [Candidatus Omnitrophota bacterium]MBU4477555.1 PilZ domain-containing protein [Candidatus Omnitrophota bacterium]MCG2703583.1 PilZ domain-containing protein [Candidatus Omnitrophota bacterium]
MERRQKNRTLTLLFIRFSYENAKEDICGESFTHDASSDGFCLLTSSRLKINDALKLNIDVPINPDITMAEGRVCWVSQKTLKDEIGKEVFPVGVEITYMDSHDKEFFEEYLQRSVKR